MPVIGEATISVSPEIKDFDRKLRTGVTTALKGANSEAEKAGKRLGTSFSSGFTSVFGAIAFGQIIRTSLQESDEALRVGALTEAVIKSTGAAAGVSATEVAELADELSRLAGVDDDVIQGAENVLLTFTNVRDVVGENNDIFTQAIRSAVDLSAALGQDLQSSVIQLGKALNDPVKGVTALQRVGVSFTKAQRDQIKELVAANRVLDAQKVILQEIQTEFGGAAEAAATPLARFNVVVGELQEALGRGLTPLVEDFTGLLTSALDLFERLPEPVRNTVVQVAALGLGIKAVNTVSRALIGLNLVSFFTTLAPAAAAAATSISLVGVAGTAAAAGLGAAALGIAAIVGPIAVATGIAAKAIGKIAEIGENRNIQELANNDLESFVRALRRVGASEGELDGIVAVMQQFVKDGKLTGETTENISQNFTLLLRVAKEGGDVVAAFTAILNNDTVALQRLNEQYGITASGARDLTDATKELTEEQKKAAKEVEKALAAQEKAADAHERLNDVIRDNELAVDRAERDLAEAIKDRAESVADAEERLRDARLDAVKDFAAAEERLAEAREEGPKRIQEAEENLAEARKEAIESVADARKRLADFDEDHARRIIDAEERIRDLREDQARAIRDANISLAQALRIGDAQAANQARLALSDIRSDRGIRDAIKDLAQERKDDAKERKEIEADIAEIRIDAAERVKDAEEDLIRTQKEAARAIRDAERNLMETEANGIENIQNATEALSDAILDGAERIRNAQIGLVKAQRDQKDAIDDARESMTELANEAARLADEVAEARGSLLAMSFVGGPLPPMFQHGGDIPRQGAFVGEAGIEFISRPGHVTSNDDLLSLLKRLVANGHDRPNVTMNVASRSTDARVVANEVVFKLMRGVL